MKNRLKIFVFLSFIFACTVIYGGNFLVFLRIGQQPRRRRKPPHRFTKIFNFLRIYLPLNCSA